MKNRLKRDWEICPCVHTERAPRDDKHKGRCEHKKSARNQTKKEDENREKQRGTGRPRDRT